MRLSTTFSMVFIAGVSAGDMQINFPGFLLPRANGASSANLFSFSSALGNAAAAPVTATGQTDRPFAVDGNTFTDFASAAGRSCDNQKNACAQVANSETQKSGGLTVSQCDDQATKCQAAAAKGPSSAKTTAAAAPAATSTTKAKAAPTTSTTSTTTSSSSSIIAPVDTPPAAAPVVATTTSAAAPVLASATLHSSDENFFYFCDP